MKPRSEDHILQLLARSFPDGGSSLLLGRGDDCAVLRVAGPLCVSSDLFLEDVHFRSAYFTPGETGHKALAVNISDVAAMGGRPLGFTLALGLPEHIDVPWLEEFFIGMATLARRHRMVLAGGDLARSDKLHICITVWGETSAGPGRPQGNFLTRGGALPGDALFLVGAPGLARVGLAVLEEMGREAIALWPEACAAHLTPTPLVDAGLILSRAAHNSRPPALMDVSDGLARDLPRLLGITGERSGPPLGAEVLFPETAVPPEAARHARLHGRDPVEEAWIGGEDYALLGACAPPLMSALRAALPGLLHLGAVTDAGVVLRNGRPVNHEGFDHFGA